MGIFNNKVKTSGKISELDTYRQMLTELNGSAGGSERILSQIANMCNALSVSVVDQGTHQVIATSCDDTEYIQSLVDMLPDIKNREKHTVRVVNEVTCNNDVVLLQVLPLNDFNCTIIYEVEEFDAEPFDMEPIHRLLCIVLKAEVTKSVKKSNLYDRDDFIERISSNYEEEYECTLVAVKMHDDSIEQGVIYDELKAVSGKDIYYIGNNVFMFYFDDDILSTHAIIERYMLILNEEKDLSVSFVLCPYDGNALGNVFIMENVSRDCGEIVCLDENRKNNIIRKILREEKEDVYDSEFTEI